MKTYSEIIQQLADVNDKLINDKISIEKAKQVAQNTQVLINAARLQLDVCRMQKITDATFFTLVEPIEKTIQAIEEKRKEPIARG